jgi:outer membrane protein OmpA-like peptidoglycan-associated protein
LNFSLKDYDSDEAFQLNIPMNSIDENAEISLENVFFDLNKSTLRPESRIELNRLVAYLNSNPEMHIEIGGHTDSRGSAADNLKLSNDRAKSVVEYLIAQGIAANRLSSKGYGSSQPMVADSEIAKLPGEAEKERAHQRNRRTAYRIVAK